MTTPRTTLVLDAPVGLTVPRRVLERVAQADGDGRVRLTDGRRWRTFVVVAGRPVENVVVLPAPVRGRDAVDVALEAAYVAEVADRTDTDVTCE